MPSNEQLHQKILGMKVGVKIWMFPPHYIEKPWPYHISTQEHLSFRPATSRACPSPSYPHVVCQQLTYEEDDTIENHPSEDDILAHCLSSMAEEEDSDMEEHFPTISLDDNFWMEEPVPERQLCIHEDAQHALCPYPCPYNLNQLHLTQEDMQYVDLNDISDFPDVMVSADDDMPSLEDILKLWRRCTWWFTNLLDTNIENTCYTLTHLCTIGYTLWQVFKPYLKGFK